ncbi:MAG TPA: tRNA (adenosine(37)-N6)-dimethylallyltransferase MiaA [Chthoniobacterales bacterium]
MFSNALVIAGPTASGKTALAVEVAAEIGAEIICADAFQIYRGLAMLTAQPSAQELKAVPHHLVGLLKPEEKFNASQFAALANERLAEIASRGRTALVVGGAGFYLQTLFGGAVAPEPEPSLRKELAQLSLGDLQERLRISDPDAFARIDLRNPRRVQRALEVVLSTGKPFASFAGKPGVDVRGFVLQLPREELFARINLRAEYMLENGAIEEVATLLKGREVSETCEATIGFREIRRLLNGEISRSECLAAIQLATRRYAKRQETWFRNQTKWQHVQPVDLRSEIARLFL